MNVAKNRLFHFITQDEIMQYTNERYSRLNAAGANEHILDLVVQESAGGPCPHCKKPWKRVEVLNEYADFVYYVPDCYCYERCDECGRSLHAVTVAKRHAETYTCPSCGHHEPARWRLTCRVCGINGETYEGKPYAFVCGECKSKSRKSKRSAMEVT